MEKLGVVLWRPAATGEEAFAEALRSSAGELAGAGARAVRVNVVDRHVAAGQDLRVGQMDPPKAGFVSFWVHEADDARGAMLEILARPAERLAAYLVVESVPLRNTEWLAPPGERTPGFKLVTCIEPKPGLAYEDFIRHWHTEHRAVALETQDSFGYVRNEIVRALTPDAPAWAAVVEESFPSEALTEPAAFYDALGSPERLETNRRRMLESCAIFLDLGRVESHPMSETIY